MSPALLVSKNSCESSQLNAGGMPSPKRSRHALRWCSIVAATAVVALGLSACEAGRAARDGEAAVDAAALGSDAADADGTASIVCDVIPPRPCPDRPLRYTTNIEPIIKTQCVSCHDGRGEQWPLTDYEDVTDWYDQVAAMVANCTMPPPDSGVQIPTADREQILTWIRCGYPR